MYLSKEFKKAAARGNAFKDAMEDERRKTEILQGEKADLLAHVKAGKETTAEFNQRLNQLQEEKDRQGDSIHNYQEVVDILKDELSKVRLDLTHEQLATKREANSALFNKTMLEIAEKAAQSNAEQWFLAEQLNKKFREEVKSLAEKRDFWRGEAIALDEELKQAQRPWYRKLSDFVGGY